MKNLTKNHYVMFGFIIAGLLFSGYLAGTKLFSNVCAFGASCPYFLGYPACYTGFITYLIMAIIASVALFKKELTRGMLVTITGVSLFGVLFSGKLTFEEMSVWFSDGFIAFVKSLPLCSVGLIFFTVIFVYSLVLGKEKGEGDEKDCCCCHHEEESIDSSQEEKIESSNN